MDETSEQAIEKAQVIPWPDRCWECGGKATRQSPDSEAVGCASCFPDWPET